MIALIRAHMPAIEQAQREGGKYRVAVLARARTHLVEIISEIATGADSLSRREDRPAARPAGDPRSAFAACAHCCIRRIASLGSRCYARPGAG